MIYYFPSQKPIGIIMNDKNTEINSKEANIALESIRKLEKASLQQSMPPSWLGIVISLVAGILVFLISAGLRDYYFLPIIALPIIIAIQRSKMKVSARVPTTSKNTVIALIGLIVIMIGLIFAGIYARSLYGSLMGPIACSLIATVIVYWMSISERNEHQNKIDQVIR
jgi:4-amino-4-deoxy-L-arabinose transferase-like glycosyltransferase